jgi:hypothetical protein
LDLPIYKSRFLKKDQKDNFHLGVAFADFNFVTRETLFEYLFIYLPKICSMCNEALIYPKGNFSVGETLNV